MHLFVNKVLKYRIKNKKTLAFCFFKRGHPVPECPQNVQFYVQY